LRKLHANLGHPPNQQLLRVLNHGGASPAALQAARELTCEQCAANVQPKPALPAQTHHTTEFNSLVGIDIKYLTG
jgi:alkylhydroperoxidase family enzyme